MVSAKHYLSALLRKNQLNHFFMEPETSQNELVLIICCAVLLLATFISAYANIQLKFDSSLARSDSGETFMYARRYLLLGISLAAAAGALDLIVIAYVPMSVRSCFSSLSIPISIVLARLMLNERISQVQLFGVMITVIGSMAAILFANHETSLKHSGGLQHTIFTIRTALLAIVLIPLLVTALIVIRPNHSRRMPRTLQMVLCAYGTAFVGALVSLVGKFIPQVIFNYGLRSFPFLLISFVMVGGSVFQVVMMSTFLSQFEASRAIPLYHVINGLILSVFATVIFSEPIPNLPGYVLGNLTSFFGLWLLTHQSKEKLEDDSADFQPLMIHEASNMARTTHPKESFMII